jgi:signal transduction histidine kinase
VANHLRPAALNFGIVSALEWLAEDFHGRHHIRCSFVTYGDEPVLEDSCATAIFRIAQESLTNVARHSRASRVVLTLRSDDASIDLEIRDDGCGPSDRRSALDCEQRRFRHCRRGAHSSIGRCAGNVRFVSWCDESFQTSRRASATKVSRSSVVSRLQCRRTLSGPKPL